VNYINQYFNLFVDPSQRLYWPFLFLSLLIIIFYTKKQNKSLKEEFLNESSLTDIKLLFLNKTLKLFVFPFVLISSFSFAVSLGRILNSLFPYFQGLEFSPLTNSIIATVFAFVIDDFFRFAHHVVMHKLKILKRLHSVHHSATNLTPFTLFRTHPIEALIASFRNVLSMGVIITFMSFILKGQVSAMDILGVNLFGFLFNTAFSNLRHSPVPMTFGPLEYVFISPRMHQIHHSNKKEHYEKNYGVALAIWDQILGSFHRPSSKELSEIQYGLNIKLPLKSHVQESRIEKLQEIQLLRLS
jgi:sterol desaturase/sphingolipid hydroxylase (fatty acid hydroxylase superfamily)